MILAPRFDRRGAGSSRGADLLRRGRLRRAIAARPGGSRRSSTRPSSRSYTHRMLAHRALAGENPLAREVVHAVTPPRHVLRDTLELQPALPRKSEESPK